MRTGDQTHSEPRDATNAGTEVGAEECEEGEEGASEDGEGEEGGDVHLSPGETHQAPPALPCQTAGRNRPLLSASGKFN